MDNLKIIDVGKKYGNMNKDPQFYPSNYTKDDINESYNRRREDMGLDYGFNSRLMYTSDQKDKQGTFFEISKDYIYTYPNGCSDIREDILVMNSNLRGVAIGYPVADSPVVMGYDMDQEAVAVGRCSSELTDQMLPMSIIDALLYTYGSTEDDIAVYISSGVEKYSYLYSSYPKWARNSKIWDGMITEDKYGLFHIDLKGAIKRQLLARSIPEENIIISSVDTVTNANYFSNRAASLGCEDKKGRNFPCIMFLGEKEKAKTRVRKI